MSHFLCDHIHLRLFPSIGRFGAFYAITEGAQRKPHIKKRTEEKKIEKKEIIKFRWLCLGNIVAEMKKALTSNRQSSRMP